MLHISLIFYSVQHRIHRTSMCTAWVLMQVYNVHITYQKNVYLGLAS